MSPRKVDEMSTEQTLALLDEYGITVDPLERDIRDAISQIYDATIALDSAVQDYNAYIFSIQKQLKSSKLEGPVRDRYHISSFGNAMAAQVDGHFFGPTGFMLADLTRQVLRILRETRLHSSPATSRFLAHLPKDDDQ